MKGNTNEGFPSAGGFMKDEVTIGNAHIGDEGEKDWHGDNKCCGNTTLKNIGIIYTADINHN